jgi:hypothetical protein
MILAATSTSPSWLVLVAAGAAGSVLTMLTRYTAIPAQVRHHDRQVADIDGDLDRFAADECARLMSIVYAIRFPNHTEDDGRPKVVVALECGQAVARSMQLYRDEETARIRERRELAASEGWAHWTWRRLHPRLGPFSALSTPERAACLLDRWIELVPYKAGQRDYRFDPRKRSINDMTVLLDKYQEDEAGTGA